MGPSDEYDTKRERLIDFINLLSYDDGSNAVQHIEFWIDEEGDCGIDSHYEGCKIDEEEDDDGKRKD